MPQIQFPSVETADNHGLVAIGGNLDRDTLISAYRQGIFPWPYSENYPIAWFSPDPRGILKYEDLKISHSLNKLLRKNLYTVRFNTNFSEVIKRCAKVKRKHQQGTWITSSLVKAYNKLHQDGYAYSVEVYREDQLVGGLYGTCIDHFFTGESMFFEESNTSKIALVYLMEKLHSQEVHWIDTQMTTSVVASLGGKEIPRKEFLALLKKTFKRGERNWLL